ncbi:TlyA family rRNA (cytidine-2'-O)-methyltransferase [bacterium (Candidatus Blackallbacteria) CG17_big_fil_post_rev_8_21_14_2_50_48_46]|uniref:TlyA family rRNA (Cytidine-2'-O)-methyltransferase n=1 Tax=bacterium (Candidatus Blackallbacteria) CG17_big_fil_post_rev_8_21_14_2_50_48_46 TaxID=2014261 RepID=A0A2M7G1L2_9BACT|nr:MAG: TlyA family rRNA (cytidine-2'-O)-methyltransferase [bacterium (Candidatus Blackallbacteria) CG18_big_fil_WC_8_21_14_2_50_49_26]PIW15618.1 MAG: TlyA family rRNA (cytidine-2'-O)-methyltransferase [bacterium (Candidatus Blackallbacteria) CG17_big_fil_post_rev_8_21_14_2_50_48_46]PIW48102.1 MAG: TlyA family rRNA (cytidine-2'-O)-methyltransferase [bacterium (Candidatus Blackallbacteria) CG13_big_fil_rev_8_21_14_2_50_49_14]
MPDPRRQRLDLLLVEAGLFPTREKARAAIMAGLVRKGTQILDKAGLALSGLDQITVIQNDCPYVSRGGLKLAGALETFQLSVQGRICLDIGASTGGFTDCLLQKGAQRVYAVDVGYGQLDWKIRNDPRVICREKVNARYLKPEDLYAEDAEKASLAVMDVSFISLLKILPALRELLAPEGLLLSLIKPQFEAAPSQNRKGIVHSPDVHFEVLENIQKGSAAEGFYLHDLSVSPVLGKGGNREFLGVFYRYEPVNALKPELFWKAIHEELT